MATESLIPSITGAVREYSLVKSVKLFVFCLAAALSTLLPVDAQTSVETGQQVYRANCQPCHGVEGNTVNGVDFRSGFRRVSTDAELSALILNGIAGTGMPPTNLPDASRQSLVAYLRSMHPSTMGSSTGDAARGMAIFEGKGGCVNCHRIGGKGSRTGPELSDVGAQRTAAAIERSIVAPNETVLPQHRSVRITMKDGTVVSGRRLNEDTYGIEVMDEKERLISVSRDDVREYSLLKTSPMPSYQGKLSAQEIADLVAYLLSQKGVQ